jgi:hypothetical protein
VLVSAAKAVLVSAAQVVSALAARAALEPPVLAVSAPLVRAPATAPHKPAK